ncbi:hypothetical protein EON73_05375 [bacterium]|nr:MAG: hypothetical protein EON73_05375 [bacterium]
MRTNETSPKSKLVVLLFALITVGLTVAWNFPVKKVTERFTNQNFKDVKEARDTGKIEQFTDIYYKPSVPSRKIKVLNREKNIQLFDNINLDTTIKSKNKFKIVLEDSVENKKEYNSINELPTDARNNFLSIDTSNYASVRKYYNSLEWKIKEDEINKMGKDVDKYYNSPEWKKKEAAINKMGRDVDNYYNSPELKKKMEDIKIYGEKLNKQSNSPEWKKQQEDIRKQSEEIREQYNSPEWKKQIEDIKIQGEEIQKQINSPEWKKQMEDIRNQSEAIRKQFSSSEWKKQQKKIKQEVKKSQKEWRKSMDFNPIPTKPEKPITPQF